MSRDANRQESARWLAQARRDLEAASANRLAGFHEWACFLSQQAAEKVLKGFLHLHGERGIFSNSILALMRRSTEVEPRWSPLDAAKRLDEVYIPSRYPNGLQEGTPGEFYNDKDADQCIVLARQIVDFAMGLT